MELARARLHTSPRSYTRTALAMMIALVLGVPWTVQAGAIDDLAALNQTTGSDLTATWESGRAVRLRGKGPTLPGADADARARAFLAQAASILALRSDLPDLRLLRVNRSLGTTHVFYQQTLEGCPVAGATVTVHILGDGRLSGVDSRYLPGLRVEGTRAITAGDASLRAAGAVGGLPPGGGAALAVFEPKGPVAVPAWTFTVNGSGGSAWTVVIDGRDGSVIRTDSLSLYADGQGKVFERNPIADTLDTSLVDMNGSPSAIKSQSAYKVVTLRGLDGSGYLNGEYVSTVGSSRVYAADLKYLFERGSRGFNEAMAYHHIDACQRLLRQLAISGVPSHPAVPLRQVFVEASANLGTHNAKYELQTRTIRLGIDGVDAAEDADLIVHEDGHAIQLDQLTRPIGTGTSRQMRSMAEGFADFLALAYAAIPRGRKLDPDTRWASWWAAGSSTAGVPYTRDPGAKFCVYPTDYVDQESLSHRNGQIWSGVLLDISRALGADKALGLAIESHWGLSIGASFEDASVHLLDADVALFGGTDTATLTRIFHNRGVRKLTADDHRNSCGETPTAHDEVRTDGTRVLGVLGAPDDDPVDCFTFEASANATYTIFSEVRSPLTSIQIDVYDSSCHKVTPQGGYAPRLVFHPTSSGRHHIEVKRLEGSGDLLLWVRVADDHPDDGTRVEDPRDRLWTNGTPALGEIERTGDQDCLFFPTMAGATYDVTLTSTNLGTPCLWVRDRQGNGLGQPSPLLGDGCTSFQAQAAYATVTVTATAGRTGSYALVVRQRDDHPSRCEDLAAGSFLPVDGTPVPGLIGPVGDVDYFKMKTEAGASYLIRVVPGTLTDCELRLEGTSQASSTLSPVRGCYRLDTVADPTDANDHCLSVRGKSLGAIGDYSVQVFRFPAVVAGNDDHPDEHVNVGTGDRVHGNGSPASGAIQRLAGTSGEEDPGDTDFFYFDTPDANCTVQVQCELGTLGRGVVRLHDKTGAIVLSSDTARQSDPGKIALERNISGSANDRWYVSVLAEDGAYLGTYTLKVLAVPNGVKFTVRSNRQTAQYRLSNPATGANLPGSGLWSSFLVPPGDWTVVFDAVEHAITPPPVKRSVEPGPEVVVVGNYLDEYDDHVYVCGDEPRPAKEKLTLGGVRLRGEIEKEGDSDSFWFEGTAGQGIAIDLQPGTLPRGKLTVRDKNGQLVADPVDGGPTNQTPRVQFTVATSGNHCVKVEPARPARSAAPGDGAGIADGCEDQHRRRRGLLLLRRAPGEHSADHGDLDSPGPADRRVRAGREAPEEPDAGGVDRRHGPRRDDRCHRQRNGHAGDRAGAGRVDAVRPHADGDGGQRWAGNDRGPERRWADGSGGDCPVGERRRCVRAAGQGHGRVRGAGMVLAGSRGRRPSRGDHRGEGRWWRQPGRSGDQSGGGHGDGPPEHRIGWAVGAGDSVGGRGAIGADGGPIERGLEPRSGGDDERLQQRGTVLGQRVGRIHLRRRAGLRRPAPDSGHR
ncbi:MAG: M36 family metallopeptidase [Candidatus Riflebacteria bacterium]|nr:M36 family metallopeptidase [Candidatus Riflebacteria bacterium]